MLKSAVMVEAESLYLESFALVESLSGRFSIYVQPKFIEIPGDLLKQYSAPTFVSLSRSYSDAPEEVAGVSGYRMNLRATNGCPDYLPVNFYDPRRVSDQ